MPGVAETIAQIAAMRDRLRNMTPIYRVIAADVQALIDRSFRTASSPDGHAWPALSPTTVAMRRVGRGSGAPRPLLDTGRLRRSATTRVTRTGVVFGTNVAYGAAQQFGNPDNRVFGGPPGPVPARPFLPISADGHTFKPQAALEAIRAKVQRWVETGSFS